MTIKSSRIAAISMSLILCFCATFFAQQSTRERTAGGNGCSSAPSLSGVYRIDVERSDRLYTVIEGVSSRVPYNEQQQFFMDLAVRLTPPDLLAIECRGNRVSLGSSRAARVEFTADGKTRSLNSANGKVVRTRIGFDRGGNLTFASTGGSDDKLNFTFTALDNGQSLRVTRRISAEELIEPVVIETVYEKISETARWDIFDNAQIAAQPNRSNTDKTTSSNTATVPRSASASVGENEVDALRNALNQWVEATNERNINKQMTFYMPELKAFYLARNASQNAVRLEKTRAFSAAKSIDIRAAEPEIIFQNTGRTAIMRFRKKYNIQNASKNLSGEVVQELRWQQTNGGWKIFSERDIKVIR
jgi:ketosteroid isomerase-like protein